MILDGKYLPYEEANRASDMTAVQAVGPWGRATVSRYVPPNVTEREPTVAGLPHRPRRVSPIPPVFILEIGRPAVPFVR